MRDKLAAPRDAIKRAFRKMWDSVDVSSTKPDDDVHKVMSTVLRHANTEALLHYDVQIASFLDSCKTYGRDISAGTGDGDTAAASDVGKGDEDARRAFLERVDKLNTSIIQSNWMVWQRLYELRHPSLSRLLSSGCVHLCLSQLDTLMRLHDVYAQVYNERVVPALQGGGAFGNGPAQMMLFCGAKRSLDDRAKAAANAAEKAKLRGVEPMHILQMERVLRQLGADTKDGSEGSLRQCSDFTAREFLLDVMELDEADLLAMSGHATVHHEPRSGALGLLMKPQDAYFLAKTLCLVYGGGVDGFRRALDAIGSSPDGAQSLVQPAGGLEAPQGAARSRASLAGASGAKVDSAEDVLRSWHDREVFVLVSALGDLYAKAKSEPRLSLNSDYLSAQASSIPAVIAASIAERGGARTADEVSEAVSALGVLWGEGTEGFDKCRRLYASTTAAMTSPQSDGAGGGGGSSGELGVPFSRIQRAID